MPKTHIFSVSGFGYSDVSNICIFSLSLSLMLRPTVSRPVCLGIKHPPGAYDQIFFSVRNTEYVWQLRYLFRGTPSLTRGRDWLLYVPLVLASAVFLGRSPLGLGPYVTVSDLRLPFSSPPTTRRVTAEVFDPASTRVCIFSDSCSSLYSLRTNRTENTAPDSSIAYVSVAAVTWHLLSHYLATGLFAEPFPSNGCRCWLTILSFSRHATVWYLSDFTCIQFLMDVSYSCSK
jgi:hypothetical protein